MFIYLWQEEKKKFPLLFDDFDTANFSEVFQYDL